MNKNAYPKLFEPIKIGNVELPNRIAMAAMGTGRLMTDQGGFTPEAIEYYVDRARGGTGLIITQLFKVENEIDKFRTGYPSCIAANPHHFMSTASLMTERVHHYNSKVFIQLSAGFGRVANPRGLASQPVAPSPIPNVRDPSIICRELRIDEVETIIKAFGRAAELAAMAGFDGIEIHAVHEGYLLDQFTIAMYNQRTDKYGGDLRGRLTFPIEVLQTIKNQVGKNFPVVLRFSIKSYVKGWNQGGLPGEDFKEMGRDTPEGLEAAKILEQAGYDAFDSDSGSYDSWYWAHPPLYQEHGLYLPLTEKLKKEVHVPVLVSGRMEIPDLAEKALRENKTDIVTLGRGLLAEPHWPQKVREGKIQNIRPCLACHDGCFLRMESAMPISCAVNPTCGRETTMAIIPARKARKVMVVGGGVGGMEAARAASLRGHSVTIYEKAPQMGGHLVAASVPSFKHDEKRLLEWYLNELSQLGVEMKTGTEVTLQFVEKKSPDEIIVATGSTPIIPNIPGVEKPKVASAVEILLRQKKPGNSVVVVGGGLVGCETALWLAQLGKTVTIIEMLDGLMTGGMPVHPANKSMLIELLKYNKVTTILDQPVLEIVDEGVATINRNSEKSVVAADTVVIAVGLKSDQELYHAIYGVAPNVHLIGDAQKARKIMNAIWDGFEVGRSL
jgi:2-enoate reductase